MYCVVIYYDVCIYLLNIIIMVIIIYLYVYIYIDIYILYVTSIICIFQFIYRL